MKTILSFTVAVVFAGLLGACASADDVDAEADFTDVGAQEDAAEPDSTSEREIAPTRDWGSCQEDASRGVECGEHDFFSEEEGAAAGGLEDGVQPNPSERWQASEQIH